MLPASPDAKDKQFKKKVCIFCLMASYYAVINHFRFLRYPSYLKYALYLF